MKRGFSLVELVMVMLIIGILSGAAVISLRPAAEDRIELTRGQLQADIRFAQSLAVNTQKRTRLVFDSAAESYTVQIEPTLNANNWSAAISPHTNDTYTIQLNSGAFAGVGIENVYFNANNNALVFDQWGNPYGALPNTPYTAALLASQGYVTLNDGQAVTVQPATGLAGLAVL